MKTRELSYSEKNIILFEVKSMLTSEITKYMCVAFAMALKSMLRKSWISEYELLEVMSVQFGIEPPKGLKGKLYDPWWPREDLKSRIECIEKAIERNDNEKRNKTPQNTKA